MGKECEILICLPSILLPVLYPESIVVLAVYCPHLSEDDMKKKNKKNTLDCVLFYISPGSTYCLFFVILREKYCINLRINSNWSNWRFWKIQKDLKMKGSNNIAAPKRHIQCKFRDRTEYIISPKKNFFSVFARTILDSSHLKWKDFRNCDLIKTVAYLVVFNILRFSYVFYAFPKNKIYVHNDEQCINNIISLRA